MGISVRVVYHHTYLVFTVQLVDISPRILDIFQVSVSLFDTATMVDVGTTCHQGDLRVNTKASFNSI